MPPRRQSGEAAGVTEAPATTPERKPAPWRGRPRTSDPKSRRIAVRVTDDQWGKLDTKAAALGLKIGGYLRSLALGSAGARTMKRASAERVELARLLGELGKVGSNVNQIAKAFNSVSAVPEAQALAAMRADLAAMRSAVVVALGCEP